MSMEHASISTTTDENDKRKRLTVMLGKRKGDRERNSEEDRSGDKGRQGTSGLKKGRIVSDSSHEEERVEMEKKSRQMEKEKAEHNRKVLMVKAQERRKEMERQKKLKQKEREEEEADMDIEQRIKNVKESLKVILEAVNRESGGKPCLLRADQNAANNALYKIQEELVNVLMREVRMEKEKSKLELKNIQLEEELKKNRENGKEKEVGKKVGGIVAKQKERRNISSSSEEGEWVETRGRRRRTYAEVSRMNEGERIEGRVVVAGKEGWKTPPLKSQGRSALIVTSEEVKDAVKLAEQLARQVDVNEIGGAPQAVRKIRDGKVVIVPKSFEQQEKIKESLRKVEKVEIRERKPVEPLIMLSGVAKGINDQDLAGKISRGLGEEGLIRLENIKIIKRISCRNNWKENVVFRTDLESFKRIVKKGKIEIDCVLLFAEEYLGITMCYRCCRFGHITKFCNEKEICYKCSGAHDGRDCREGTKKCINCFRMYGRNREHGARDMGCHALREILEKSRLNINYAVR